MEITLEKIELVKDRTGVSYKEAKEALEAADGNVVDAIIAIEETIDVNKPGKANEFAADAIEKIKELVKKGNITKISIKKDNDVIVNVPVTVGIVGTLLAPWGVVAAAIAAFGFKCNIELTTDEGKVINISDKAGEFANTVVEKGSVVVDEVVTRGSGVVNGVMEKAPGVIKDVKEKGTDLYNTVKDAATDKYNEYKTKKDSIDVDVDDAWDAAEEKLEDKIDDLSKKSEEACDKAEEITEQINDAVSDKADEVGEKIDDFWKRLTKGNDNK